MPAKSFAGYLRIDGDSDEDDHGDYRKGIASDDRLAFAVYPQRANAHERSLIVTVVKRYYAAALRGDGATVCSLLDTNLLAGVAARAASSRTSQGKDCPSEISYLLKTEHQTLVADDIPTMLVTDVRLSGNRGLAVLGFKAMPEGELLLRRQGHRWKLDVYFNGEMP